MSEMKEAEEKTGEGEGSGGLFAFPFHNNCALRDVNGRGLPTLNERGERHGGKDLLFRACFCT